LLGFLSGQMRSLCVQPSDVISRPFREIQNSPAGAPHFIQAQVKGLPIRRFAASRLSIGSPLKNNRAPDLLTDEAL